MSLPEGLCFRCKRPIVVIAPGKNQGLCEACVKHFQQRVNDAARKKGDDKKKVFHHPDPIKR
jgi:predicted amidophosphoribosyltransferase